MATYSITPANATLLAAEMQSFCFRILFYFLVQATGTKLPTLLARTVDLAIIDLVDDVVRSWPSTVQPTDWAVPRISFITPENSLDMDLGLIVLAALMTSSRLMLPLCLMFFTFFLSRGGSFSALMTRAAAEGTTVTVA